MDISVRELKNRLSEFLRRVQSGEEVHVTLRGRRIARLLPETASAAGAEAEALARLDAMPWMRRPKREGRPTGGTEPLTGAAISSGELARWLRD